MSQANFRDIFLDNILSFLWRQWSALGVLGEAGAKDPWAIDPEALLIFSLEAARYEPRLFDEILDWLLKNGKWLDIQRLRGILRKENYESCHLMGAASEFLVSQGKERKWKNLADFCLKRTSNKNEVLFKNKDGSAYPIDEKKKDEAFAKFDLIRSVARPSKKTREVPSTAGATIRFMLRAFFGVGSRAECILYLLTHDGGHPAEVAKAIGLSIRGTQDSLIELSKSGLVLTRIRGKRKIEYWLSQERWWEFLTRESIGQFKRPVWIGWIELFTALSKVWKTLNEVKKTKSDYMRSSKLRGAMEIIGDEFARSGIDIPQVPGREVGVEEYEKAFEEFIGKLFGAKEAEEARS